MTFPVRIYIPALAAVSSIISATAFACALFCSIPLFLSIGTAIIPPPAPRAEFTAPAASPLRIFVILFIFSAPFFYFALRRSNNAVRPRIFFCGGVGMVINFKRRSRLVALGVAAAVAVMAICFVLISARGSGYARRVSANAQDSVTVIVDAGHGGMDGGATAQDGTVEKDINLSIALKLRDMLDTAGYNVIMTRETDDDISDSSAKSVRRQKVSDIKNRMKIIEQTPDALFVSIHQNHYGGPSYSGAQVFYSKNNPESEKLAKAIQQDICSLLQPQNRRAVKRTGTEIYLLYHAESPAVMVECGFLSNAAETPKAQGRRLSDRHGVFGHVRNNGLFEKRGKTDGGNIKWQARQNLFISAPNAAMRARSGSAAAPVAASGIP